MALILIYTGSGSIGKLQSFIVVTAVPVSLVLLPSLWDALRITLAKGRS
jgi:choline-glycine betaine transporter